MKQKSYQPDYGPTEYDLDFNFELELSFSDYLLAGVYFIFVLPVLTLLRFVQSLFRTVTSMKVPSTGEKEKQIGSPGLLSFVSKIF